jgi:hypothetical protein
VGFLLIPLCPSVFMLALVYGTISLTFNMVNTAINSLSIWLLDTRAFGRAEGPPMSVAFLLNAVRQVAVIERWNSCGVE